MRKRIYEVTPKQAAILIYLSRHKIGLRERKELHNKLTGVSLVIAKILAEEGRL